MTETYHLHPKTGSVHMDQAPLTYSSADTCPVLPKRPVVVIDPEDREQVERLALEISRHEHVDCYSLGCYTDRAQAALREFANPKPAKPDEPTGLGAVVRDAHDQMWIRAGRVMGSWYRPHGHWSAYADIDAVEILSEGVES